MDICTDPLGTLWAMLFANPFDPFASARFLLNPLGTLLVAALIIVESYLRNCPPA